MKGLDSTDFDVVIVGGGMVGATMACLLQRLPVSVALIDRQQFDAEQIPCKQKQPQFDPRVSALTAGSKKLFTELRIWQEVEDRRCCAYMEMAVWDADGTGSIQFSAAEIKQPELGTIVENSIISAALYSAISEIENLQLLAPYTIEELRVVETEDQQLVQLLTADGVEFTTRLLVAADGANSRIRELADFKTREWDYHHQALVTTVKTELPHGNTALQRFIDTGPLAFLPLSMAAGSSDQHFCSIVWSAVPERAEQLLTMSDDRFKIELAANIEHRLGAIEWVDKRVAFPLRQRHAIDYVKDNIVLIGDAAHTIHPLAGQGVNLGLLDAVALAEELGRGLYAGRALTDPTVLSRYQRKRIGHNLGMMWLMEGFKHLFAEQALPVRWLRNAGMSGIDNMSVIKNKLARRAMGVD